MCQLPDDVELLPHYALRCRLVKRYIFYAERGGVCVVKAMPLPASTGIAFCFLALNKSEKINILSASASDKLGG